MECCDFTAGAHRLTREKTLHFTSMSGKKVIKEKQAGFN